MVALAQRKAPLERLTVTLWQNPDWEDIDQVDAGLDAIQKGLELKREIEDFIVFLIRARPELTGVEVEVTADDTL